MQDKLKKLEKQHGVDWREYEIGELFESSNGDFDIQAGHINGKGNWVVSSGETNSGIIGKTDIPSKIFDTNTITVDMFGTPFYRNYPYKMVTHARVFSLKMKNHQLSNLTGNYFVATLNYIKKIHSYSDMASFNKIKDYKITLPTKNNAIAFDYIEEFVSTLEAERLATLEAERLATLEAYLQVTGLKNTQLTDEERQALEILKNVGGQVLLSGVSLELGTCLKSAPQKITVYPTMSCEKIRVRRLLFQIRVTQMGLLCVHHCKRLK